MKKNFKLINEKRFNTYGYSPNIKYYKKLIINNKLIKLIKSNLYLLGFNLDIYSSDVPVSKSRIVQYQDALEFCYITYKDKFLKIKKKYIPKIPNIEDIIKKHFFKKFNNPKRLKYENEIGNNYPLLNDVWALPQKPLSRILYLDIDDGFNSLNLYLGIKRSFKFSKELLLEQSINGNLHVAIRTTTDLDNGKLKEVQKYLQNKFSSKIEVRLESKPMRLPGSHSYKVGYLRNNKFIPYKKEFSWIRKVSGFYKNSNNDISKIFIKKNKKEEKNKSIPLFIRKNSSGQQNKKKTIHDLFPYGSGMRYFTLSRIVSYGLRHGYSKLEIYQATLSNNNGSKDIRDNIKKHKYEFERCYNSFSSTYRPRYKIQNKFKNDDREQKEFISNLRYIPQEINTKKLNNDIWNNVSKNKTFRYDKWRRKYKDGLSILLKELIGLYFYNLENERIKNPLNPTELNNKKIKELLKGFVISNTYLNRLKKEYNLRINVINLFKLTLKYSNIIKIENKKWSYRINYKYCRQYNIIRSILYLYLVNKYNNKYNIINNKYGISKVLVSENENLEKIRGPT